MYGRLWLREAYKGYCLNKLLKRNEVFIADGAP